MKKYLNSSNLPSCQQSLPTSKLSPFFEICNTLVPEIGKNHGLDGSSTCNMLRLHNEEWWVSYLQNIFATTWHCSGQRNPFTEPGGREWVDGICGISTKKMLRKMGESRFWKINNSYGDGEGWKEKGKRLHHLWKKGVFAGTFLRFLSRVPLPPGSLFPSRTSLWIQSGGRTLTPLELDPGDGDLKPLVLWFSLLKSIWYVGNFTQQIWESWMAALKSCGKNLCVFCEFKAPMYTTLGITASQVFF